METSPCGFCMRSTMPIQRLKSRGGGIDSQEAQRDFIHALVANTSGTS